MTATEKVEYVNKSGKRLDGRKKDELRPIKIEAGVIPRADGSCYLEWGQNKVIVGVYGPKEVLPKHTANPYRAIIRYNYRMATFSVSDRKNPRPARREIEISKVSGEALENVVLLEKFPNTAIDVEVQILDSNAGTRIAALAAAAVALADAGIPMKGMVSGATVGRAGNNILLDLTKDEEDAQDAVDIPLAINPATNDIVFLQLDGLISKKEWESALKLGIEGCQKVHELQKAALVNRFQATKEASK